VASSTKKLVPPLQIGSSLNTILSHDKDLEDSRAPSLRNGEISFRNRSGFMSSKFLTTHELKHGSNRNLESINRSFSKLSILQDRNWSLRDLNKEAYTSPHNF